MKNIAIILASGSGKRAGFDLPKQFQKIKDKTICEISIEAFEKNEGINEIILVVNEQYKVLLDEIVVKNNYKKITKIVFGGAERIDSSRNGVFAIDEEESNILIHDCVRPFVSQRIINDCINALNNYSAVDVAANVTDTIFIVDDLCDAGGTFVWASKILREKYPNKKLGIFVRHLVNPIGLTNLVENFDYVVITDSYRDWNEAKYYDNVKVVSCLLPRDRRE